MGFATWSGGLDPDHVLEVPGNAPYYSRLGFKVLAEDEMTGLLRIREREATRGLSAWPRVTMRRALARVVTE